MHLKRITFLSDKYPDRGVYPFNIPNFTNTDSLPLDNAVTFFVGENGTGKSTLLKAIARKCDVHIWEPVGGGRLRVNRYEEQLYRFIDIEWRDGPVPGSFFASEIFNTFAQVLEECAISSTEHLKYFGGKSLITQSHGQSHMSFFKSRYRIKGIYFLDEPENALSPKRQLELLRVLKEMSRNGRAQFIIATHSPIILASSQATIYSFDTLPIKKIDYENTNHYRIYKDFLNNRKQYQESL